MYHNTVEKSKEKNNIIIVSYPHPQEARAIKYSRDYNSITSCRGIIERWLYSLGHTTRASVQCRFQRTYYTVLLEVGHSIRFSVNFVTDELPKYACVCNNVLKYVTILGFTHYQYVFLFSIPQKQKQSLLLQSISTTIKKKMNFIN